MKNSMWKQRVAVLLDELRLDAAGYARALREADLVAAKINNG